MSRLFFFFQAEDGIRDLVRSRGLGDVYKRQGPGSPARGGRPAGAAGAFAHSGGHERARDDPSGLSLIHI